MMPVCRWCTEAFLAALVFWAPWQVLDWLKHRAKQAYMNRRKDVSR